MIVKILLSIIAGILLTCLLTLGVGFVIWCISEFICCIRGCIEKFQCTKPINCRQLFLSILDVISLLGTVSLILSYVYFQL